MTTTEFAAYTAVTEAERRSIVIGVLIAMLLAALDQTIVAPALPTIGATLGDPGYLSWIVSAYFLTSTAVTPLYGKLADIHGRRLTLFTALGLFLLGSAICALAPSMLVLVAGRAVQGLGGGGLMSLAQTVIGDLVPPKERGRFVFYISGTWAIASVAGPVLGGLIAEQLHWRMIFWLNFPLALLAYLMTNEVLKRLPWPRRKHSLDMLGAGLLVAATIFLMLTLTWGGARYTWGSPVILGLMGGTGLLTVLLGFHLSRTAEPLIPLAVLGNPVVLTATLSVFFAMAAYIGLSVHIPLYLELVQGLGSSMAGLVLVGYMGGTVIGANAAARLMQRMQHYKRPPAAGLVLAASGVCVLAWFADSIGTAGAAVLLFLIGIGSGALFPITTVSVQNAVAPHDLGVATGALGFLRSLGSAIGVSVLGAVGTASGIVHAIGAPGGTATAGHLPGSAFTPVFLAAALCLAGSFVLLMLMDERPLRGRAESGDKS